MNKAQKAVQQAHLNNEAKTIRELKQVYNQARKDCEARIRELSSRTDLENLQSIIYQKQYQQALKKQLDGICDALQGQQFNTVADYLQQCYKDGFIGVMYDLHNQGIPIVRPIDQKQVVQAIQTDSKISQGLYKRMGEDTTRLKNSIRAELSRGISQGKTWNEIAGHIANGMNSPFNKAINRTILISRTEGHRVQQKSALDAQYAAKEKGADVLKQWCATLDSRTRPTHGRLDGQIRELEEDFEVDGLKASAPGHFGKAKEDCNCRCCILQRARWALDQDELDELKQRAAFFGLDKSDSFQDFCDKYLHLPDNADTIDITESGISLGGIDGVYGKKHSKAIIQHLENAPSDIRKVWNDCCADFHALEPNYRGSKAFYSPGYDGVKLNITAAGKGSDYQTPYQVVFHEYGHHADYILNRKYGDKNVFVPGKTTSMNAKRAFSETYKNGIFGKTIKDEANKAIEDFAKKNNIYVTPILDEAEINKRAESMVKRGFIDAGEKADWIARKKKEMSAMVIDREAAETAFCKHIKEELTLIQRSDISDMFEPVMSDKHAYPFGVGHGSNYWKSRDNGKEGFAEIFSAEVNNPESLEQIKKYFPESYKIFKEMIGVIK